MTSRTLAALAASVCALALTGCSGCAEEVVLKCAGITCGANASCDEASGACACSSGFTGDPASGCTPVERCGDGSCSGHGTCDDSTGAVRCACSDRWAGPACAECATDFAPEAGACINEKKVACRPPESIPAHAHAVSASVKVTYTTAGGWTEPATCAVACDADYEASGSACINEKEVACRQPSKVPDHGHVVGDLVKVTYTSAGGWTEPATCAVECDTDYALEGGACINEKETACAPPASPPDHATLTNPSVKITFTTQGGWTPPAACVYECEADHALEGERCLHEKRVPCRDAAPADATSIAGEVTVTYATGAGWSAPAECAWACDDGFHQVGQSCVANALPASCAAIKAADPAAASGAFRIDPDGAGAVEPRQVHCDMTAAGGLTFLVGGAARNDWASISAACPAGFVPFEVRGPAHADALESFVTSQPSGDWFWANFFAGPAADCSKGNGDKAGWLTNASTWNDAGIASTALAPLDIAGNCNNAFTFDPIPVGRAGGIQNRGSATFLYNSTEQELTGQVVCSVPEWVYRPGRYLVFELFDHHAGDGATVTEIGLLDRGGAEVAFTAKDAFDSVSNGPPAYWSSQAWSAANLSDGDRSYTDNGSGAESSTILAWSSPANSGAWGRFALQLAQATDLGKVRVWAGSPEGRIPHYIKVYAAESLVPAMVQTRTETGLALIGTIFFGATSTSVTALDVDVPVTTCWNGLVDVDETDVDCGTACAPCALGKACETGDDCASGGCCGGVCVDLAKDAAHCGSCENACSQGVTCQAGSCSGAAGLVLDLRATAATGTGFPDKGCGASALGWQDLAGKSAGTLTGFVEAQCTANATGWQGDGTCASPHRLVFDGAGDHVVVPNANGVFNLTSGLTVEVWFNARSIANGPVLVSTMDYPGYRGFYLEIWNSKAYLSTNGNSYVSGNTTLTTNRWYHVAATYDGAVKRFYLDGQPDGAVPTVTGMTAPTLPLLVGMFHTGAYALDGSIAAVRVYDRALTDAQIKADYDWGKSMMGCP